MRQVSVMHSCTVQCVEEIPNPNPETLWGLGSYCYGSATSNFGATWQILLYFSSILLHSLYGFVHCTAEPKAQTPFDSEEQVWTSSPRLYFSLPAMTWVCRSFSRLQRGYNYISQSLKVTPRLVKKSRKPQFFVIHWHTWGMFWIALRLLLWHYPGQNVVGGCRSTRVVCETGRSVLWIRRSGVLLLQVFSRCFHMLVDEYKMTKTWEMDLFFN